MSLQSLIEKMKDRANRQKKYNHEIFQKHSDEVLKLIECCEVMQDTLIGLNYEIPRVEIQLALAKADSICEVKGE